jgi:hypothetical protein
MKCLCVEFRRVCVEAGCGWREEGRLRLFEAQGLPTEQRTRAKRREDRGRSLFRQRHTQKGRQSTHTRVPDNCSLSFPAPFCSVPCAALVPPVLCLLCLSAGRISEPVGLAFGAAHSERQTHWLRWDCVCIAAVLNHPSLPAQAWQLPPPPLPMPLRPLRPSYSMP